MLREPCACWLQPPSLLARPAPADEQVAALAPIGQRWSALTARKARSRPRQAC
jgi:hypothetical protein